MITHVRVSGAKDSFLADLPVYGRRFEFTPGLNVIFGGNGLGKTTLLRLLAGTTSLHGISSGGPAGLLPDLAVPYDSKKSDAELAAGMGDLVFRKLFPREPKARLKFDLGWERTPVLFVEGSSALRTISTFGETGYGAREELDMVISQRSLSAGKAVMARLGRALSGLPGQQVPYFTKRDINRVNDLWQQRLRVWNAWVDRFPEATKDMRPTILLDEPDLSHSLVAQAGFWRQISDLSRAYQIIAVSHSPFALSAEQVIDLPEGYAADCRSLLGEVVGNG